jgi:hypothetical protein
MELLEQELKPSTLKVKQIMKTLFNRSNRPQSDGFNVALHLKTQM